MVLINRNGKPFSKINVTNDLRIIVNRISADQDRPVYEIAEELFKTNYPNYFIN